MRNKKDGNSFERAFANILFNKGFWVLNVPQTIGGQCSDIIAVINNDHYLIDCKLCAGDKFPLSRIEPNQSTSMYLWSKRCNTIPLFALKTSKGIYMIDYNTLLEYRTNYTLTIKDITTLGVKLEMWLERRESAHCN